jgi:RimJ/RimL family protein N-acetyltransferase
MHDFAHVFASPDTKFIAWVEQSEIKMIVGLNAFLGKTCQIHVAMAPGYHFTPRAMMETVFEYVFNQLKVEKLLGIVNSTNEKAMRYDLHLGFKEEHRMVGMHDDGGDIVLLAMDRADCKYLKEKEAA